MADSAAIWNATPRRSTGACPSSGAQLLDVACGAGQLSLIAARAGARVTGCDISSIWLLQARRSAAAEGLTVVFEEGDAEAVPYENATFDAVVSLIGAMFAPRPELVAAELTRVCRPGGIIAMANWTGPGFVGQMFKTIAKHIAPFGMPSPGLAAMWTAGRESILVDDRLDRTTKEAMNAVLSQVNDCPFRRDTPHFEHAGIMSGRCGGGAFFCRDSEAYLEIL